MAPFALSIFTVCCGGTAATKGGQEAADGSTTHDAASLSDATTGRDAPPDSPLADASLAVDTGIDAPTCPNLLPSRLEPCPALGQVCLYTCGTAFVCTTKGWDYDLTIDAGPPCP